VAETGKSESWPGRQADWFSLWLPQWKDTGIRLLFIWTWKQYWPGTFKEDGARKGDWYGMWEVDEHSGRSTQESFTGRETSGLSYLKEYVKQRESE